jgi:hypothetical protein
MIRNFRYTRIFLRLGDIKAEIDMLNAPLQPVVEVDTAAEALVVKPPPKGRESLSARRNVIDPTDRQHRQ